jgi:hypothetical protein
MPYTKTPSEIEKAFRHQVMALAASCRQFDLGDEWEAARIASALHILLYDSGKSRSILHQLGIKDSLQFVCTGGPIGHTDLIPTHPLVKMEIGPVGSRYLPIKNEVPAPVRHFKFKKWWKEPVFAASQAKWVLTRGDLISNMRNQDGGGHFDGALTDERYVEFSRAPQWVMNMTDGTEVGLMGLEQNTMRQLGWEVLESLKDIKL